MRKTYPLQYPGVLAVWGAMQYAREHGYAHFEFIEAGFLSRNTVFVTLFCVSAESR